MLVGQVMGADRELDRVDGAEAEVGIDDPFRRQGEVARRGALRDVDVAFTADRNEHRTVAIAAQRQPRRSRFPIEPDVKLVRRLAVGQAQAFGPGEQAVGGEAAEGPPVGDLGDRKSTRLELQSLMRISYAVFCLKKKKQ